ncbi:modification methylase [Candidatus Saccharibacteria bacterium]|nr:modification methylase [Candidatus Saccharibacteria bacterium]
MGSNANFHKASIVKNDEFYTRLVDIEDELKYYKEHFKNKVIFCNCDDPYESNFFKYFAMNFNRLELKKIICTSYTGSPIVGEEFSDLPLFKNLNKRKAYKVEITEVYDENGDGAVDLYDIKLLIKNMKNKMEPLQGDGDFRSKECVELLKEADIVVTNPPFSIAREYFIPLLIKYNKKFLIIGDLNWVTYKNFFPLIKDNKIWFGHNCVKEFIQPNKSNKKFGNKLWYTNLDIPKRHEKITPYKEYTPEEYPKYDNYDAINVDKIAEIPDRYYKPMGVPITFLNKYNPDQFDILGIDRYINDNPNYGRRFKIDGKEIYARIIIKRKDQNENRTPQN